MSLAILVPLIGAAMAAALTGALFKPGDWYKDLIRPSWTPPSWAFPVVWTTLYALMTWAAIRLAGVALSGGEASETGFAREAALTALAFHGFQLVLNANWSPLFFGAHRAGAALAVIGTLFIAVLAELFFAAQADPVAALLLAPYPVWLAAAFMLNLSIWRANPPEAFRRPE